MAVMNTIDLEGVSDRSWGEAAREALREAAKTIRGINRLDVLGTSTDVEDGGHGAADTIGCAGAERHRVA